MTYLNVSSTEVERTTGRDANGDEILEAVSGGGGGGVREGVLARLILCTLTVN